MSKPQMNEPHINFVIQGVIVLCFAAGKKSFDIGIVKGNKSNGEVQGHDLEMEVWEFKKNGGSSRIEKYKHSDLASEIFLDIRNSVVAQNTQNSSPAQGIEFFGSPTVDRINGSPSHDFSWMLDIDNDEMHQAAVNINPGALRSVLRVGKVERGIFYTASVSDKHLVVTKNGQFHTLGRVAAIVEALVSLPPDGAIIKNGKATLSLESKIDTACYKVTVKQACNSEEACNSISVSAIYEGLYSSAKPEKKIHLSGMSATPGINPFVMSDIRTGTTTMKFGRNAKLPKPE